MIIFVSDWLQPFNNNFHAFYLSLEWLIFGFSLHREATMERTNKTLRTEVEVGS